MTNRARIRELLNFLVKPTGEIDSAWRLKHTIALVLIVAAVKLSIILPLVFLAQDVSISVERNYDVYLFLFAITLGPLPEEMIYRSWLGNRAVKWAPVPIAGIFLLSDDLYFTLAFAAAVLLGYLLLIHAHKRK